MTSKMRIASPALGIAFAMLLGARLPSMAAPVSPQVERLAGLAKLWGAIKFFHPYIAEQNIDWDAALIQTIPKAQSASNPEEYRKAIDYLLSFLRDPGTHTIAEPAAPNASPSPPASTAQPYVRWTDDRIAIVVANDFGQFAGNFSKLPSITKTLAEASNGKGIVFDLRGRRSQVPNTTGADLLRQLDLLRGGLRIAMTTIRKLKHNQEVDADAVLRRLALIRAEAKAVRDDASDRTPSR